MLNKMPRSEYTCKSYYDVQEVNDVRKKILISQTLAASYYDETLT